MNRLHRITLDPTEERIKRILVTFAGVYSEVLAKPVTLRITGGWVRDKLLGRSSHDIDIAVNVSSGEEFAISLYNYMERIGEEVSSVHKIARNPEKSKHLETATSKLYGLDVDFVNLRSEKYTTQSRIPEISVGTPLEDALRRDATLNALFYNLETGEVEDFTERGMKDLSDGILRTPLDPVETFRDDPLRILRLLRFAGQLDFTIAEDALEAMKLPNVRSELSQKVSRERMGVEILKLVESKYARRGLKYLIEVGIAPSVFELLPAYTTEHQVDTSAMGHSLEVDYNVLRALSFYDSESIGMLYIARIISNWAGVTAYDKKKRAESAANIIVSTGIKLSRQQAFLVAKMVDKAAQIHELAGKPDRLSAAQVSQISGPDLKVMLAYMACQYNTPELANDAFHRINEYQLADAYLVRPLLDGKAVMSTFPGRRPGPWLAEAQKALLNKQFEDPAITPEGAKQYLLENHSD